MDIINRKTLTVFNQKALDGIIEGCSEVQWPYVTSFTSPTVPSPFPSGTYDLSGRCIAEGHSLKKGIYIKNGRKIIL